MNRISRISLFMILATLAAVGLYSCSDDTFEHFGSDPDRILLPGEYRFIISCDDDALPRPASRVGYESVTASRFETGDHIGVFASNSERQIQNDVFAARNMNDDSEIQVLAPPAGKVTQGLDTVIPSGDNINYLFYYPMNEAWTLRSVTQGTGLTIGVEADQSAKEGYEKSDFLWNYLPADPGADYQVIKMHHLMANIVVKIHRDSIDTSDGKGVTLCNFPISASGIHLTRGLTPGDMNYAPQAKTATDIRMFQQGESGNYLIYRAVVPAWHTLPAGTGIIKCNLYNRAGETEEVTFSLNDDLSLRDGYYYNFTLRSEVKAAIPDVSDEDSWVFDVFDPETHEIVGMLCREYIRYQPHHNTPESNVKVDAPTAYYEGAYSRDPEYPINGYAVSSQAYVFYNLFSPNIDNTPDLENGTILRMLYDVVATRDGIIQGDPAYPYPHHAGSITVGDGGDENMAMGIFMPRHGHRWIYDESLGYGRSSDDWTENWLHGAKIHWTPTNGHFYGINEDTELTYYKIERLELSDRKISNSDAYYNGHIAIPQDGSAPFVSYAPFDEDAIIDSEGNKIAYILQHFLVDTRDNVSVEYPLVKIGFNSFWMSTALRATTMNDGTILPCHNSDDSELNFVDFKTPYQEANELGWFNWTILSPSYLHPRYNAEAGEDWEDIDFSKIDTPHPLLYNYSTITDNHFIPSSDDSRFILHLPNLEKFQKIINYFGWCALAKLMSSDSWIFVNGTPNRHSDAIETKRDALLKMKCVTNEFLPANVSGFNLKPLGNFNNEFRWFGGTNCMWIDNEGQENVEGNSVITVSFNMPNGWQSDNFDSAFIKEGEYSSGRSQVLLMPNVQGSSILSGLLCSLSISSTPAMLLTSPAPFLLNLLALTLEKLSCQPFIPLVSTS